MEVSLEGFTAGSCKCITEYFYDTRFAFHVRQNFVLTLPSIYKLLNKLGIFRKQELRGNFDSNCKCSHEMRCPLEGRVFAARRTLFLN
jgi:hypothetical protein